MFIACLANITSVYIACCANILHQCVYLSSFHLEPVKHGGSEWRVELTLSGQREMRRLQTPGSDGRPSPNWDTEEGEPALNHRAAPGTEG